MKEKKKKERFILTRTSISNLINIHVRENILLLGLKLAGSFFCLCSFLPEEGSCGAVKESSAASPSKAEPSTGSIWPGSSRDPQVDGSGENNEGAEPQLVFSFLSQPHSPTRGKGQGDQERTAMGNDVRSGSGWRHEARPEDDFIGSESDEVCLFPWKDVGV